MTSGFTKSEFNILSNCEWLTIFLGLALSVTLYFLSQSGLQNFAQANGHLAVASKTQQKVIQTTMLLENPMPIAGHSAAIYSLEQVQSQLALMLSGGQIQGQQLQAQVQPQLREELQASSDIARKLIYQLKSPTTNSLSQQQSDEQISILLNQLSQAISELEKHLHWQLQSRLKTQQTRVFTLIAVVLLLTALGVVLIRRDNVQQKDHRRFLQQSEVNANIAKEKLQQVIEAAELGYYDWFCSSGRYEVNQRWLTLLGMPLEQSVLTIEDVMGRIHPDDYSKVQQNLNLCVETGEGFSLEFRMRHQNEQWIWVESSGKAVERTASNQSVARICGTLHDINERKKIELEFRENDQRFRQLIESLPTVAVQGYDKDRKVIYWNDASAMVYGYNKREALGNRLEDLIIPEVMKEGVIQLHSNWVHKGEEIPAAELELKHKDGHMVPVFSSHVMLKEGTDSPEMFCVDVDLTPQHKAANELKRLATLDILTNLPNRRFLEDELTRRISEAERFGQQLAVLFIDIDLFKEINDTMGHNAGDILLQQVSERLRLHLRKYDTLSRFGGDEFIIVLPNINGREGVEVVAEKIMSEFNSTFHLFEQDIYISASIGVSIFPEDGNSSDELLKHSDTAMYQAKEAGRSRYRFFDQSMNELLRQQRKIATDLRHSLETDEFMLVYQPQVELKSGTIIGCEALLRWQPSDPSKAVSPGLFIPVAERSDLIVRLGYWVLRAACRQAARWKTQGIDNIRVDINVSGKQLEQGDFFEIMSSTLQEHGLRPRDIGIELTEHALIRANSDMLSQLQQMKDAGMQISIDDFGTGYSSLNYLKNFPVHHLKIDRAFVTEAPQDQRDQAILEAIVEVGHKLDLTIVVEGIETQEQAEFCLDLDCDLAQGYWFHKPMAAADLYKLLKVEQMAEQKV